ncbi:MAG: hypothetical protein ABSG53_14610 [Thermoguttaceae bacterium]
MNRYPTCLRALLTLLIVLTGVSASQAGLFGRWRTGYYYPACAPATVATPAAPSVPATGQPKVSTTGPTVYTAAKPVIGENAGGAATPVPQNRSYAPAPAVYSGSSWSTLPRSSWDFGKFPPYSN